MLAHHTDHGFSSTSERLVKNLKRALPEGKSLPDNVWETRHRGILALLWLHVFGIVCFGLLAGYGLTHSLAEGAILVPMAIAASWKRGPHKFRSAMTSLGLVTASALIIHLSGGYIEMHFHFFVMLAVIVLYQDWLPFLLAIGYVFIHHGVMGVVDPFSVYNHPDAFAHPWKWAAIHGAFVLAASIASIIAWRLNEGLWRYNELILNSTGEGIIGLDDRDQITFMNPAAATMIGYRVEDLRGQPLTRILNGPTYSVSSSESEHQTEPRTQIESVQTVREGLVQRKNGTSFMAEYIHTPIREAGGVVGAVVAFTDITERQQAQMALQQAKDALEIRVAQRTAELEAANEQLRFELAERQRIETALRASEERTRLIINTALDAVITVDAAGLVTDWNNQAETIFGWSRQEIMGQTFIEIIMPIQHRAALEQSLKQFLTTGETAGMHNRTEVTALHRAGREFPIELSISPLQLGDEISFCAVIRDITKRKQNEAALVDSEARYKAIATTMPGAIYQFTSRAGVWTVDYMAPQTLALFGVSAEDFMADINNFIGHIHPDDLPHFVESVTEVVEKLTPWNYEGRVTNPKTGELIWWQGMSTPVATTSGEVIFNGVLLNITKRKQDEAALAQARDQALESSRFKSELLANVSHELRTPLGAILGYAELLLDMVTTGPYADQPRQMIAEIIDSTHYLTNMVNGLLDQAQLEAGRLELTRHPFHPADLVDAAVTKMSILAQIKGLKLSGEVAAQVPPTLSGDVIRLQQILVNLIGNAIKFTSVGTVQVWLTCPDPDHWALQVSDTGTGIPLEAQAYIFEPFRQVDGTATRLQAGTGLGLSIVKQLTDLMGGKIILDSAIEQGSTFTIVLPHTRTQDKSHEKSVGFDH